MPRSLIKVTLATAEGEVVHEVSYDGRDIRAYEAEFDASVLTSTTYTQVCQIAFCAMRRQGLFVGSWEVFDAQCLEAQDRLDLPADEASAHVGEVDPGRPTLPAPEAG